MRQAEAYDSPLTRLPAGVLAVALLLGGCSSSGDGAPGDASQQQAATDTAAAPDSATAAPPTATDQGRSVQQRVEDAALAARVKTALLENRELRPFAFDPSVTSGRVTLAGNVATRDQGRTAADVAADVEGVDGVRNRLTVNGQQVAWNASSSGDDDPQQVASSETSAAPGPSDGSAPGDTYHTVQTGESLWAIAREYDTSVSRVRELNNLRGSNLQAGKRLLVKRGGSSASSAATVADAGAGSSQGEGTQQDSAQASSEAGSGAAAGEKRTKTTEYHVVKRGDTLYGIARENDMSVARLKELNSLSGNGLMPGDRLRVE